MRVACDAGRRSRASRVDVDRMLTWLASYPRSGNTYFRLVLHYLSGLPTYSVYEDRVGRGVIAQLVGREDSDLLPEAMAEAPQLYTVKTHDLPRGDQYPAIYLVRDGRDALTSYAHYILSFEKDPGIDSGPAAFSSTLRELIVGNPRPFGSWSENVSAWSGRQRTVVVRFEDLVKTPLEVVRRAMSEVGGEELLVRETILPSFEELHRLFPEFFRRGQVGGWRTEMSPDLHELFWKHHENTMRRMGYAP